MTNDTTIKHILFFGASRGCGLEAAVFLLQDPVNYLTLFLRNPEGLDERLKGNDRVKTVSGDCFDIESVRTAFQSIGAPVDTVIFSIGSRNLDFKQNPFRPPIVPAKITERCISNIIPLLREQSEQTGVHARLVAVSSSGLGPIGHRELPLVMRPMYSWMLHHPHADKIKLEGTVFHAAGLPHIDPEVEKDLQQDGLTHIASADEWRLREFILVRPAFLTNGDLTEKYRVDEHLVSYTVSRLDIGHFIATQCVGAEKTKWVNKAVTIGN
ncbi:uncharacterized protein EV422DRAFT_155029 [Fimicolochytrium jonesii]|uniref:uncharacterized protein n=1 Tax=Fimicolochytrium jonesii TaxID=1396493 RepID=UPI0022FECB3C|nr:uncharacterized protein EV422DRAFT_155029 [Fimicolochytrium jonesii]KAI8826133.1 hypothetical protein EV422DRAFT_155029 [Fimicolochytrium jonesii]